MRRRLELTLKDSWELNGEAVRAALVNQEALQSRAWLAAVTFVSGEKMASTNDLKPRVGFGLVILR